MTGCVLTGESGPVGRRRQARGPVLARVRDWSSLRPDTAYGPSVAVRRHGAECRTKDVRHEPYGVDGAVWPRHGESIGLALVAPIGVAVGHAQVQPSAAHRYGHLVVVATSGCASTAQPCMYRWSGGPHMYRGTSESVRGGA